MVYTGYKYIKITYTAWKNEKELVRSVLKSSKISTPLTNHLECGFRVLSDGCKNLKAIQTTKGATAATHTS